MKIKHKFRASVVAGAIASVSLGVTALGNSTYAAPANTAFKDDNFYECVVLAYNNATGSSATVTTSLTDAQLAQVKTIACDKAVTDASGAEKLTGLQHVVFTNSSFATIDLSNSPNVQYIEITHGQLASIALGSKPALTMLKLYNNKLTSLDVSGATNLNMLSVANNQISQLTGLSKSVNSVYIYGNNLTGIDLTGYPNFSNASPTGELLADDILVTLGLHTDWINGRQYANLDAVGVAFGLSGDYTKVASNGSYVYYPTPDCPVRSDAYLTGSCIEITNFSSYPGYVQFAYNKDHHYGSANTGDDPTKTTYKIVIVGSEGDVAGNAANAASFGTPNTGILGENGLMITLPIGIVGVGAIAFAIYYYGYRRYTDRIHHFGKGPLGKKF